MEGVYHGWRWTTWFLRKEGVKPSALCSLCRESPYTRTVQLGTEPQQWDGDWLTARGTAVELEEFCADTRMLPRKWQRCVP